MPRIQLLFFRDEDDRVPLVDWLASLSPKARAKCVVRLERLEQLGHELRRPEADYLRDDIYELRAKQAGMNYRMLYFFHGRRAVVVSHGFSKQQAKVPARDIKLACERKKRFEQDPDSHIFKPED